MIFSSTPDSISTDSGAETVTGRTEKDRSNYGNVFLENKKRQLKLFGEKIMAGIFIFYDN